MPSLELRPSQRAAIFEQARARLPLEACGLLVGTKTASTFCVLELIEAANLSTRGQDRYQLDPVAYMRAERLCQAHPDRHVLGFWHSHPQSSAQHSSIDLEEARGLYAAFQERYLYLIVSMLESEAEAAACWRLDERGEAFEPVKLKVLPK